MKMKNLTLAGGAALAVAMLPPVFQSLSVMVGEAGLEDRMLPLQEAPLLNEGSGVAGKEPLGSQGMVLQNCRATLPVSSVELTRTEHEKQRPSEPLQLLLLGVGLFSAGLCRFRRRSH